MRPTTLAALLTLLVAAAARPARADVLELNDGRLVEGDLVRDGDVWLVRSRFGVAEIPASEVKARHEGETIDRQVADRLASLDPEDTVNRALLARWLLDLGREDEARALAEAVLEVDPECAVAHEVLGHVRHRGLWVTPDEAKRREGLEQHGDRWYTPQEWANLEGAAREAAEAAEAQARARQVAEDVNRAVRLMTSPDPAIRDRGRERLLALARELDEPRLVELAGQVDAYVKALDDLREAAAVAAASPSGTGTVLGEFRATMSRLKRPIKTFETGLASNLAGGVVRIQLPELEVIKVRTTAPIPVVVR